MFYTNYRQTGNASTAWAIIGEFKNVILCDGPERDMFVIETRLQDFILRLQLETKMEN